MKITNFVCNTIINTLDAECYAERHLYGVTIFIVMLSVVMLVVVVPEQNLGRAFKLKMWAKM
jgi:hypothetical protein